MVTQKVCDTRSTLLQEQGTRAARPHRSVAAYREALSFNDSTVSYFPALTLLPATGLLQGEDALVQTVSNVAYLAWT